MVSFVAQRMRNPGTVEIGIVAAGSNRATTWTRILEDHVWPDKPRWSPDGRTLYFISRGADGYFNLWGVPIDPALGEQNGKPHQVTYFSSPRLAHRSRYVPCRDQPCQRQTRASYAEREGQHLALVGREPVTVSVPPFLDPR
jgi:WD40-like Beta Propeller Repeat